MNSFLIILLLFGLIPHQAAYAHCTPRTLKQVCTACRDTALSSLNTDSLCPACPEVNCPAISQACIQVDSFEPFLKKNYTISTNIGGADLVFKLNFLKNEESPGTFYYDVRSSNYRSLINNALGFLFYDIVNFNLPIPLGNKLFSYNCIGAIDNTSILKGVCSTVAQDEDGKSSTYGFQFTAIPSNSPL